MVTMSIVEISDIIATINASIPRSITNIFYAFISQ